MNHDHDASGTFRLTVGDGALCSESGRRTSLLVFHGERAQLVRLDPRHSIELGRDPSADIAIGDHSLSRRHVRFEWDGSCVWVEDLRSTNGTRVNGQPITVRTHLLPGDEVSIGAAIAYLHEHAPLPSAMPGILGHDRFRASVDEEIERARHLGRRVALVSALFNDAGSKEHDALIGQVRRLLRPFDRLGRYRQNDLEMLLPEMGLAEATAWSSALCALEMPPARVGVAIFPEMATSSEALLHASRQARGDATPDRRVCAAPSLGPRTMAGIAAEATSVSTEAGSGAVFVSSAMRSVLDTARRFASAAAARPVLIHGETGTGKELIARMIHEHSPRKAKPLCSINCAAIPASLVEDSFFGHERGAFTSADEARKGIFEIADGGTVFLDEIGELSDQAQGALLRVLEEKRVARVGGHKEIDVDFRIVAATNRDLERMSALGKFRQDLWFRLNVTTIRIPPLRDRPEDVIPLAHHFLELANRANGTTVRSFAPEAMELLCAYPWPGNVRELRNTIDHAVVIAAGSIITASDLPERVQSVPDPLADRADRQLEAALAEGPPPAGEKYENQMQRFETEVLLETLRAAGGNQSEAARRLGISRRSIVQKIKRLGLKRSGYSTA